MSEHVETDERWEDICNESTTENIPIIIKFGATWCGPCKLIAPYFEQLATKYGKYGKFLSLDVDEMQDVSQSMKIRNIPAFVVMKKDEIMQHYIGSDKHNIRQLVVKHCG